MSLQGLGMRAIHHLESVTGLHILRASADPDGWHAWRFTTADHHHGRYHRSTRDWVIDADTDRRHIPRVCGLLFGHDGATPLERDGSWGRWCDRDRRWHVVEPRCWRNCPACAAPQPTGPPWPALQPLHDDLTATLTWPPAPGPWQQPDHIRAYRTWCGCLVPTHLHQLRVRPDDHTDWWFGFAPGHLRHSAASRHDTVAS